MLGNRLAKLRKRKGLSQYEVADRIGFSRGKYSNYEQGSRKPDPDTLKLLADFYDVSTDYLLGREEKTKKSDRDRLIDKINSVAIESLHFEDFDSYTEKDLLMVYNTIKLINKSKEK